MTLSEATLVVIDDGREEPEMAAKLQVKKCTNGNIRLVHTGRYGDETRLTLDEDEAAALVADITQHLASD